MRTLKQLKKEITEILENHNLSHGERHAKVMTTMDDYIDDAKREMEEIERLFPWNRGQEYGKMVKREILG